jgi:hypothetical protein
VFTCTPTTDQSGNFTCSGFDAGSYVACAKHSHTLQRCIAADLGPGPNSVNFGTLLEGDANDDNCVLLVDFSVLSTAFSTCSGDAKFDTSADFDLSGCVVLVDFSLLVSDFGQCGDVPPGGAAVAGASAGGGSSGAGTVQLLLVAPAEVDTGAELTVTVVVDAGEQMVDGAAAYLRFDPDVLEAVSVTDARAFDIQLLAPTFDNTAGTLKFAAGSLQNFRNGRFDLLTVVFRARRDTDETSITFERSPPRLSDATFAGASVLASAEPASLRIGSVTAPCPSDCDDNHEVTVDELTYAIAVALGSREISGCTAADTNDDQMVTVDEIVAAVSAALSGC